MEDLLFHKQDSQCRLMGDMVAAASRAQLCGDGEDDDAPRAERATRARRSISDADSVPAPRAGAPRRRPTSGTNPRTEAWGEGSTVAPSVLSLRLGSAGRISRGGESEGWDLGMEGVESPSGSLSGQSWGDPGGVPGDLTAAGSGSPAGSPGASPRA
eukprot:gene2422-54275_t